MDKNLELNVKLMKAISAFKGDSDNPSGDLLLLVASNEDHQSNCVISGICSHSTIVDLMEALLRRIYIDNDQLNEKITNTFQSLLLGMNLIIASSNPDFFKRILASSMTSDEQLKAQIRAIAQLSDDELVSIVNSNKSKDNE